MTYMSRSPETLSLTIAEDEELTEAFYMGNHAIGTLIMPAEWTAASIGFVHSYTQGGTYLPLKDHDGNLVQIASPAVDESYEFPPETAGCFWLKLWSQDGAGSDEAQAAERVILVGLKS